MALPLYIGAQTPKMEGRRPQDANTGLFYDKFVDVWTVSPFGGAHRSGWGFDEKAKIQWVQTVTGNEVGDPTLVATCSARLQRLVESLGGEVRYFKTDPHADLQRHRK